LILENAYSNGSKWQNDVEKKTEQNRKLKLC